MDFLQSANGIYRDLAVIGVELLLVGTIFIILNAGLRLIFQKIGTSALSAAGKQKAKRLRHQIVWRLFFFFTVLAGFIVAINGFLIYQGENLFELTSRALRHIPYNFWQNLILAVIKVVLLMTAVRFCVRIFSKMLKKAKTQAKAFEGIKANDESIERVFESLNRIQTTGLWMGVFWLSSLWLGLPSIIASTLWTLTKIYLIVAVGTLVVKSITAIIDSLDALSRKYAKHDNVLGFYKEFSSLMPLFQRCLAYSIYVFIATLVIAQIGVISRFAKFGTQIIQSIGVFFLCRLLIEICYFFIEKKLFQPRDLSDIERKRRMTFVPLLKSFLKYIIIFLGLVFVMKIFQLNPTPILAGAGILGIVVGLGAQPVLNDLVSGFFILFENLFLVGDYIETATARGFVEAIDIRTTRLRDPNGQLHILRNGQLGDIVNFSKGYTYAVVEVGVSYTSDINHVYKTITEAGRRLLKEQEDALEPTIIRGIKEFGDSAIVIRMVTKVNPGKHLSVSYAFRKILKEAFEQAGIEIPFPQRVLHMAAPQDLSS